MFSIFTNCFTAVIAANFDSQKETKILADVLENLTIIYDAILYDQFHYKQIIDMYELLQKLYNLQVPLVNKKVKEIQILISNKKSFK